MQAYTFRNWVEAHRGQGLLYVRWGYWKELGKWPAPGRIFQWSGWLPDLSYYLRCRLWRRYNRVVATTLPPTWQDADNRLLHVSFAILVDVVEKEDILHHCAWTEHDHMGEDAPATPIEGQFENLQEIATLYDWWKNVRPLREDPTDWWVAQCAKEGIDTGWSFEPSDTDGFSRMVFPEGNRDRRHDLLMQSHDMEVAQDAEDTEMLCRLAHVRQALWT
jgi:hypothetical protein